MRLLHTETAEFVDFPDELKLPKFAILSHTWDLQGEQSYQDLKQVVQEGGPLSAEDSGTSSSPPTTWNDPAVSSKVRMACATARAHGYRYIWIDSCCIDKTSSAELSEAINSMYRWYGRAAVCYAFLADVSHDDVAHATGSQFRRSKWFTRGWTLQELIAPRNVVFLSQTWQVLGSKSNLALLLEEITGIEHAVLTHDKHLSTISVAARMSWASRRTTTRLEDEAYSLLGIFDINMPTLYGEGRRAFMRLQEEILKYIPDQSLFAWGTTYISPPTIQDDTTAALKDVEYVLDLDEHAASFFASSPSAFRHSGSIRQIPVEVATQRVHDFSLKRFPIPSYTVSPYGMRTEMLLLDVHSIVFPGTIKTRARRAGSSWYLAILPCEHTERQGELLGRVCIMKTAAHELEPLWGGSVYRKDPPSSTRIGRNDGETASGVHCQLVCLRPRHLQNQRLHEMTRYLPYLRSGIAEASPELSSAGGRWDFRCSLPEWQKEVLRVQGYDVTADAGDPTSPSPRYCLTLSNTSYAITLEYQYRVHEVREPSPQDNSSQASSTNVHSHSDLIPSSHSDELTVWLDAAVVPLSGTLGTTLDARSGSQNVSGPHVWSDFRRKRFEFPKLRLEMSEVIQATEGARMDNFGLVHTLTLKIAIEPVADMDLAYCSHEILVEVVETRRVEESGRYATNGLLPVEPESDIARSDRPMDDRQSQGGVENDTKSSSWASKVGSRFKRGRRQNKGP